MPERTTANKLQRAIFKDISRLKKIALTTKATESLSVNIHGAFTLFDKHWRNVSENPSETMLALNEDGLSKTQGEPSVHFHIDWREIRCARIQPRRLELINTDYEIVFCENRSSSSRKFWFYLKDSIETRLLIKKWGTDWISLQNNYNQSGKYEILEALFNNYPIQQTIN